MLLNWFLEWSKKKMAQCIKKLLQLFNLSQKPKIPAPRDNRFQNMSHDEIVDELSQHQNNSSIQKLKHIKSSKEVVNPEFDKIEKSEKDPLIKQKSDFLLMNKEIFYGTFY